MPDKEPISVQLKVIMLLAILMGGAASITLWSVGRQLSLPTVPIHVRLGPTQIKARSLSMNNRVPMPIVARNSTLLVGFLDWQGRGGFISTNHIVTAGMVDPTAAGLLGACATAATIELDVYTVTER